MEREKIKIPQSKSYDVIMECHLTDENGNYVEIEDIVREYEGSSRHTEQHSLVFQRKSDGKFFRVGYETSVKDSMGWDECNWDDLEAVEVFPKQITTTIYE